MDHTLAVFSWAIGLFTGMLLLLEAGRRIGIRWKTKDAEEASAELGTVEGAVFGLMSLLIAFTFSGAASRFDARRHLIIEETNAIGTAYLRLDLIEGSARQAMRESFRRYVDARLEMYRKLPDARAAEQELARATALQGDIWNQAVAACRAEGIQPVAILLLPALNQVIDITTTRKMVAQMHPPTIVFAMLGVFALASSLLAGCGMAGDRPRRWIHVFAFAAVTAFALFVILDIEFPRSGLFRIDAFDQPLVELRQGMD